MNTHNHPHDSENGLKVITRLAMLTPGMYIFRYASKHDAKRPTPVTLQAAPMGRGNVDFFPAEGIVRNTLYKLGDCVITRVKGHEAGVLIAEYHACIDSAPVKPALVRIDQIDTSENFQDQKVNSPTKHKHRPAAGNLDLETQVSHPKNNDQVTLRLMGHIERHGDVVVTNGWLGNPQGNARIEGFAIEWESRPEDVDLVYTCRSEAIGQMPAVFSGHFAGTRGKASPITAISFALTGSKAIHYTLSGQAIFAGCPPVAIEPQKKLSGHQGTEQLVAINVKITYQQGEAAISRYPSPWRDTEVTQIFRKK